MPGHSPSAVDAGDTAHHLALVTRLVGQHPESIDEVAVDLWARLCTCLVMIIGDEGFDALFDRSVHLTAPQFPWLSPVPRPSATPSRFEGLRLRLQGQEPAQALQATVALLATFTAVLVTLIGQPLTTNLLRAAWGDAFDAAAPEVSPCPQK